ncbi:Uncharacterised protein [Bergeyella zoohelcum]|uniref:CAAX prenyl protease 2/Lysostaphin resistance protein A-like domain-containing protein n=1 Tax=Bergeyella zoohelcum TaxID=1015 RepID=A0A7Z8YMW9_9FLAO|nr:Uncharacterised protein [Bergeyella zoohelcum]
MNEIIHFLIKGKLSQNSFGLIGNLKFVVSRYFGVLFSFLILAIIFSFFGMLKSDGEVTSGIEKKFPDGIRILLVCIIAPVLEELIFRLPLKINKINLSISLVCFSLFMFFLMKSNFPQNDILRYLFVCILFFSCLYLILYRYNDVNAFLKNHYIIFLHLLTISFCLAHFGNYNFKTKSIVPYLIMFSVLLNGYLFSYVRLRFGIQYSIFIHMFHNTLVTLPIILKFFK